MTDNTSGRAHIQGVGSSSRGRALVAFLLAVVLVNISSDFFHKHAPENVCSYTSLTDCAACQLEATVATPYCDPAPLPPVPVVSVSFIEVSEDHPFVPSQLPPSGRAPPSC
ncbi:MAG TPA: hypothetical protein VG537_11115 [Candidatus Kapabacteria bacterium]|nr:hypothetical protein [Candidatus Kapabacteria bacterium]